eukprot:1940556-Rhodomonas_salina.2
MRVRVRGVLSRGAGRCSSAKRRGWRCRTESGCSSSASGPRAQAGRREARRGEPASCRCRRRKEMRWQPE